jgi:hypothetical protein
MTRHETAVSMIESRLDAMRNGDSSVQIQAETGAYTEMAYALSAIDCKEYETFVKWRARFIESQHEEQQRQMRRFA